MGTEVMVDKNEMVPLNIIVAGTSPV